MMRHLLHVMAGDGSREDRSRSGVRRNDPNRNLIDFGQPIEDPLNRDDRIAAALFEEAFVLLITRQVTIPGMHIPRPPLEAQLHRKAVDHQTIVGTSTAREYPQCTLYSF